MDWILGSEVEAAFPLFQCNCYEVVHTFVGVCIQFGALSGHIFEYWVDRYDKGFNYCYLLDLILIVLFVRPVPRDMMLLTFEGWCMLQCHQIPTSKPPLDFPFSFLPALAEGYFSDLRLPLNITEDDNTTNTMAFGAEGDNDLDQKKSLFLPTTSGREVC